MLLGSSGCPQASPSRQVSIRQTGHRRHMSLEDVLRRQDGVISRQQVLGHGGSDDYIERMIRRRQWARVLPGVYVEHTGPLTWKQRAWAGVLYHAPAALGGASALRASGFNVGEERTPIELVVAWPRRVADPPTLVTSLVTDFDAVVLSNLSPPRLRIEHAALQVASRAKSEDAAVAVLGDAAAGTNSALERRYLRDVELAHGLPVGHRQVRVVAGERTAYRRGLRGLRAARRARRAAWPRRHLRPLGRSRQGRAVGRRWAPDRASGVEAGARCRPAGGGHRHDAAGQGLAGRRTAATPGNSVNPVGPAS